MRISHVQATFSPEHGGPYYSLSNYCVEQRRAGHTVSVRTLSGLPGTTSANIRDSAIDLKAFPVEFPSKLGCSRTLRKQIRNDISPDVYHLHGAWMLPMVYAANEARRRRRPYVLELMGAYESYSLRTKWLRKTIARICFQDRIIEGASALHVNSATEGEQLRRLGFKGPLAVLPVGVDMMQFVRSSPRISTAPPQGEACAGRRILLYVARVHEKKGIELLLPAWCIFSQQFKEWTLVVAGEGEPAYVERCKGLAARLGIDDSVRWLGHITSESKVALLHEADAYVLPSLSENFGNSIAEALAAGTMVITTKNTPWGLVEDAGCGLIASADIKSIAGALLEMGKRTRPQLKEMGALGRRLVEERFSLHATVNGLERLYHWVINGGKPPPFLR